MAVGLSLTLIARNSPSRQLRFFGPAAVIVGVFSGIYHASTTFLLQILDFAGMYVFCFLLLTLNLERLGWVAPARARQRFWQLVAGTTVLTVGVDFMKVPIQGIVLLLIVAIVASEVRLHRQDPGLSLRFFGLAVGLIVLAALFSLLDVTRLWCNPSHPFLQGHAIWHVLSAASLAAAYLHYRQLEPVLH